MRFFLIFFKKKIKKFNFGHFRNVAGKIGNVYMFVYLCKNKRVFILCL